MTEEVFAQLELLALVRWQYGGTKWSVYAWIPGIASAVARVQTQTSSDGQW